MHRGAQTCISQTSPAPPQQHERSRLCHRALRRNYAATRASSSLSVVAAYVSTFGAVCTTIGVSTTSASASGSASAFTSASAAGCSSAA